MRLSLAVIMAGILFACREAGETPVASDPKHQAEIRQWQQTRATNLQKEDGWLSLIGLHWIEQGTNRFGSDASNDIVIKSAGFPSRAGVLVRTGDEVRLQPEPGVTILHEGKKTGPMILQPDTADAPTILQIASVRFNVIKRGERLGLRVKDAQAESRLHFKGLEYYPVDAAWRKVARFEPYQPGKQIPIPNIIGTVETLSSPGALVFEHEGKEYRLDPLLEEEDDLFVIFRDQTAPRETYGAGRYLYTKMPGPDGTVVVDFNKAYNPPCAFTAYATCPLPPPQNVLPVAIRVGEKKYADSH